jgi:hypothetical protein
MYKSIRIIKQFNANLTKKKTKKKRVKLKKKMDLKSKRKN